jgi:hypothetical protein
MDLQYYKRRRQQELEMEAAATSPEAASVHAVLALFYAEKVRRLIAREVRLKSVAAEPPPRLAKAG